VRTLERRDWQVQVIMGGTRHDSGLKRAATH
jgi:hypothetical protein